MAKLDTVRDINKVTLNLGGKERVLKFDMNALAELEALYGSIEQAMNTLESGKLKDVRNMIWAGICHEEVKRDEEGDVVGYNIRPYDVGAMIKSPAEIPALAEQIFKAISKDMSLDEAIEEAKAQEGTDSKNQ